MHSNKLVRRSVAGFVLAVVGASAVWFVYRPWALRWGSTDEEIARAMPGDELLTDPSFNATRAVTINATPEEIWPWLVQIGYRRAGFYSYDRLDNDGVPSADRILPEYQGLGGNALLYSQMEKTVRQTGFEHAELTQVAETAVQMRRDLENLGSTPYKNHRVYAREL